MGTIAGHRSRIYHGYLIAALEPPVERRLLLAKLDENVSYDGVHARFHTDVWSDERKDIEGLEFLQSFRLEGTIPVWTYQINDATIQKRVWMEPGGNSTYIAYRMVEGSHSIRLSISALGTFRDHHGISRVQEQELQVTEHANGVKVQDISTGTAWYLLSENADISLSAQWQCGYHLSVEAYRGLPDREDLLQCGTFKFDLNAGDEVSLVCTLSPEVSLNHTVALEKRLIYEQDRWNEYSEQWDLKGSALEKRFVLAADQFIVDRQLADGSAGRSIIAGYPWFADWGRDTMIALPGLTISTGRFEICRQILRTYATHVDQGMLPNRFPDEGEDPEYNTVDATLWFFEALRAYFMRSTDRIQSVGEDFKVVDRSDRSMLEELFPILQEIIKWHKRGTRYGIGMDPDDGLLQAGEPGVQLTWMDAKIGDWVVTPRIGKPVEINALWYNSLRWMEVFAEILGKDPTGFRSLADRVLQNFDRFWNPVTGCLYDLIDGPEGADPSIRPNQLFALALPYTPLSVEHQASVFEVCERELWTERGLLSLNRDHPDYIGSYGGDRHTRDAAYHQGTVWGWLIGPYIEAFLRVNGDRDVARGKVEFFLGHLNEHGVGSLSEIFDGNSPHSPRGCPAQAWTVAETLRVWQLLNDGSEG